MILCKREDCPVERIRAGVNAHIMESEKRGEKFQAKMDFCQTCQVCAHNKSWVRYDDGDEREIVAQDAVR